MTELHLHVKKDDFFFELKNSVYSEKGHLILLGVGACPSPTLFIKHPTP